MPQISIRERYLPFSHTPGVSLLFPGSSLQFECFPTRIKFDDLLGKEEGEIVFPLKGPVTDFTVVQDLEKGRILLFGKDEKGYFRFTCKREGESVVWVQEKGGEARWTLPKPQFLAPAPLPNERLSVVSYQKKSWERLVEKGDWIALFGTLYRFLMWYPAGDPIEGDLKTLILGGFDGILCPTGKDTQHKGYALSFENPMTFLQGLRAKIEQFFVQEKGGTLSLCPGVPQELPAGRIKGLNIGGVSLDIEWRKHLVRRVSLSAEKEKTLRLQAKGLSFAHLDGKKVDLGRPILLPAKHLFFLDKFLKG